MSAGMAEATSRIAQLQSMLGLRSAGVLGGSSGSSTSANGSSGTSGAGGSAFADALSEALGTTRSGGTADAQAIGKQAVALARTYSGVPYLWGGTDPAKGLDCSGLVQLVYGKLGVSLPRVAEDQAKAGTAVPSLEKAQPGDLVFFGSPAHHVGIYVGDGQMIDAPRAGKTVGVHSVSGYGTVLAIRRVSGTATAAGATAAGATAAGATAAGATAAGATPGGQVNAASTFATELLAASGLSGLSSASPTANGLPGPYANLFAAAGTKYGIDPALLSAVARTESGYNASAVSPAGARGLMQLMPGTARSLGVDPDDPAQAVDGAARLLSSLLDQFGGRTDLALAGYNAGPGAVRRYGGVPPFSETRTYVQRVNRAWEALR